jgi:hypothetical protein
MYLHTSYDCNLDDMDFFPLVRPFLNLNFIPGESFSRIENVR